MSQDDANTHPTESAATSADTEAFTTTSELKKEPIGELTPDSTPTLNQESVVVVAATGTSEAVDPPGEITSEDLTRERNPIKEDYLTKKDDALETNPISPSEKPGKYIAIKEMASDVIVSSSKKSRPPYKFDPDKITLRFLFANRDGLTVTVECKPTDTVGEVKGALISAWPEDVPICVSGENLRLICMGKGFLTPDTRTLEDFQIPVFKTHPTPVNVSVKPGEKSNADHVGSSVKKKSGISVGSADASAGASRAGTASSPANAVETGCGCVIL